MIIQVSIKSLTHLLKTHEDLMKENKDLAERFGELGEDTKMWHDEAKKIEKKKQALHDIIRAKDQEIRGLNKENERLKKGICEKEEELDKYQEKPNTLDKRQGAVNYVGWPKPPRKNQCLERPPKKQNRGKDDSFDKMIGGGDFLSDA